MNSWKIVLAAVVIFCAGVIAGNLLVRPGPGKPAGNTEPVAVEPAARPPADNHGPSAKPEVPLPRLAERLSKELVHRLDKSLHLTPAQSNNIARIVAEGQEIYARKLTFAEASHRIDTVHQPYHAALGGLLREATGQFGLAVLVDWHSMPSAAARTLGSSGDFAGAGSCDLVLGDRFGTACDGAITDAVERALEACGYRVTRNAPYAGGYTTEFYGRPSRRRHALQIEINRALYLDEASLKPHIGFSRLKADLEGVFAALAKVAASLA